MVRVEKNSAGHTAECYKFVPLVIYLPKCWKEKKVDIRKILICANNLACDPMLNARNEFSNILPPPQNTAIKSLLAPKEYYT